MLQRTWTFIAATALVGGTVFADAQFPIRAVAPQLTESIVNCPFCSSPSLTLAEQLVQSDATLLVKWIGGKPAAGNDGGSTDFEVVDIVRQQEGGGVKRGGIITLARYRAAKAGSLFLLMGTKGGPAIDWGSPLEVTAESFAYIKHSPTPDAPADKRLKYFLKYLEDPDPMVSTDAYSEFANAPYTDITTLAPEMPREKLRKWIVDKNISPNRIGLYGLMLGLCGTKDDVAVLERKILETGDDFRYGIDGVMGGYLLLTREQGLTLIEKEKITNKKVQFSETYAAMQALRFMWQYGDGRISPDRLKQSMRLMLERPELSDLVIADLARWKDWSIQDRLMKMYGEKEFDMPTVKRAIVRFMLVSVKDVPAAAAAQSSTAAPTPSVELPAHAVLGAKYLAQLEEQDPKTVADAKRFYFVK